MARPRAGAARRPAVTAAAVPYAHAQRLAAASGAGLWTLPGVAHAATYPGDPDAYTASVIDSFDLVLRTDLAQAGR